MREAAWVWRGVTICGVADLDAACLCLFGDVVGGLSSEAYSMRGVFTSACDLALTSFLCLWTDYVGPLCARI